MTKDKQLLRRQLGISAAAAQQARAASCDASSGRGRGGGGGESSCLLPLSIAVALLAAGTDTGEKWLVKMSPYTRSTHIYNFSLSSLLSTWIDLYVCDESTREPYASIATSVSNQQFTSEASSYICLHIKQFIVSDCSQTSHGDKHMMANNRPSPPLRP